MTRRPLAPMLVALAACRPSPSPVVDAPVASLPDASLPDATVRVEAVVDPAVDAAIGEPEDDPAAKLGLGGRCDPSKGDGRPTEWGSVCCSPLGRVVGIYVPGDAMPGPPQSASVLTEPRVPQWVGDSYVAVDDRRLWVRRITCPRCRRVLGWGFVGDLAALRPEQIQGPTRRPRIRPVEEPRDDQ